MVLLLPWLTRRSVRAQTKKMYGAGTLKAMLEPSAIYNTPISAYVIPHDKISEGNIEEFLQDIEHHRAFADRLPA